MKNYGGCGDCRCLSARGGRAAAAKPGDHHKLDRKLNDRADRGGSGTSRVIVTLKPGWDASGDVRNLGGRLGRRLGLINGQVVELPNWLLRKLADSPAVESIVWDRPTSGDMKTAAVSVGARSVREDLGYDGAGVGVAIIDSGVANWHDDLTYQGANSAVRVSNGQRVAKFVDFVNGRTTPTTTTATGRTSPASSPATATTRAAHARVSHLARIWSA